MFENCLKTTNKLVSRHTVLKQTLFETKSFFLFDDIKIECNQKFKKVQ